MARLSPCWAGLKRPCGGEADMRMGGGMRELREAVVVRGRAREVRRGGRKEGG